MTYNPSIPTSTQLISASQAPIKDNFTQLNTQFGVDHISFNNGGVNGTGHHKQVTIDSPLGADPVAAGTTGVFYTKTVSAKTQPFFINSTRAIQLSSDIITYTPSLSSGGGTFNYSARNGFYYKSGGLTFFFGTITTSTEVGPFASDTLNVSLPTTSINQGSAVIYVLLSPPPTTNSNALNMGGTISTSATNASFVPPGNGWSASGVIRTYQFSGFYQ